MTQFNDNINFLSTELSRHRRSLGSYSPHTFAEIYMKSNCYAPYSGMHKEIFTSLLQMTEQRKGRLAIAAPRGHAKS
ncbi:MAG TPA: hypothetical protein VMW72_05570, partial [Sedimentisphaerales bacterium]|nr:hypothetical protein [Sedimentisphaerales bacterium]